MILDLCEPFDVDPEAPWLAQLGWTMETLNIAMSLGQILFCDRVIDELEAWEKANPTE